MRLAAINTTDPTYFRFREISRMTPKQALAAIAQSEETIRTLKNQRRTLKKQARDTEVKIRDTEVKIRVEEQVILRFQPLAGSESSAAEAAEEVTTTTPALSNIPLDKLSRLRFDQVHAVMIEVKKMAVSEITEKLYGSADKYSKKVFSKLRGRVTSHLKRLKDENKVTTVPHSGIWELVSVPSLGSV